MRWRVRFTSAAALVLLAACSAQGPIAGSGAALPPAEPFTLSPGDKVKIVTYGEESLTGDFEVSPAGTISFPLIGAIKAAGLQPDEFSRALATRLEQGYLLEPKVSTQVIQYRPIYILGEVNKPGEYPYTQGLTIRGAVAKADGFTYRANEKRVFLKRMGEPGEKVYPLTADFPVLPGDTIRFGERYF